LHTEASSTFQRMHISPAIGTNGAYPRFYTSGRRCGESLRGAPSVRPLECSLSEALHVSCHGCFAALSYELLPFAEATAKRHARTTTQEQTQGTLASGLKCTRGGIREGRRSGPRNIKKKSTVVLQKINKLGPRIRHPTEIKRNNL